MSGRTITVGGRSRLEENSGVTLVAAPTLDALAETARHEHDLACRAARKTLEHAIRCGASLAEARRRLRHGDWYPWLETVGIPRSTANVYMRLAAGSEALRANGIDGIRSAREFLKTQNLTLGVSFSPGRELEVALVARNDTRPSRQVAADLGVDPSTVRRYRRQQRLSIEQDAIERLAAWFVDRGYAETVNDETRMAASEALAVAFGVTA